MIGDIINKMVAECEANRAANAYIPSDDDVCTALQAMLSSGYEPTFDPTATRVLATWYAAHCVERARRGLLLYGQPGTGKTFFLSKFSGTRLRQAVWFVDLWKSHNWGEYFNEIAYGIWDEGKIHVGPVDLAIDDLSQEPVGIAYGAREEVMERVLCDRYRHWHKNGAKTFITSNRSMDELQSRYGRRIMDRLGEMCLLVEFTGKSARTGA